MEPEYNSLFQSMKPCMSHSTFSAFSGLVWVIPVLHVRQLRPREPADLPQVTGLEGGGMGAPTDPTSILLRQHPSLLFLWHAHPHRHRCPGRRKVCTVTEAVLRLQGDRHVWDCRRVAYEGDDCTVRRWGGANMSHLCPEGLFFKLNYSWFTMLW